MSQLAKSIQETRVEPGKIAIYWLGGAGFVLKNSAGIVVYIDPYLSDALDKYYSWKRLPGSPIIISPEEVEADVVLITHSHEDHLDPDALPLIAKASSAVFVGPESCATAMNEWGLSNNRVLELNEGQKASIAGVGVSAVLANHVSNAGAQTPDAIGYVIDMGDITVYHTGDTLYHPDLSKAKTYNPDVLMVCINGGYGNMGPEEAGQLAAEINPGVVIPMHWGLVAENTSDPVDFLKALVQFGSQARPMIMAPGDLYLASCVKLDRIHMKGQA